MQVVVLGLNILLPLMTTELLKFPKLCNLYYNLLVYVLENYPDQVCCAWGGYGVSFFR